MVIKYRGQTIHLSCSVAGHSLPQKVNRATGHQRHQTGEQNPAAFEEGEHARTLAARGGFVAPDARIAGGELRHNSSNAVEVHPTSRESVRADFKNKFNHRPAPGGTGEEVVTLIFLEHIWRGGQIADVHMLAGDEAEQS